LLGFILDGICANIRGEVNDVKIKERYLEDLDWAEEHHSELLKEYRDRWVAVYKSCQDRQSSAHLGIQGSAGGLQHLF